MHYRRSHCYQPHHMASKIPHRKNLADPEFIPRSLRLKIAMSAPSFMAESPVLTQQEEGLQEDIKDFQKKVKERFANMNSATIETLTLQLQKTFISNLKELAKICFLTFLPIDPT
mmetsp:Transcript_11548/g.16471  ORF Transcript_11548/g.16471 Transcript_11548/m.16471 type:complete len:115 (+) Transcript_11548:94-438(+)